MIGATALWLMYAWLLAAIVASYLSNRKGYGEKTGLAFGLLLHVVGVIIWLVWPAKDGSKWKTLGPVGRRRVEDVAPHAAALHDETA
jgi:fucose permease